MRVSYLSWRGISLSITQVSYVAAVEGLYDSALDGRGIVVGAIFIDGANFAADTLCNNHPLIPEECTSFMETGFGNHPVPPFDVAVFGTWHNKVATSLILSLVFPEGTDSSQIDDALVGRIENYESIRYNRHFISVLSGMNGSVSLAFDTVANGLPVAIVVIESPNPPPTPLEQDLVNALVISWIRFLKPLDVLFLAVS